jgi:hypothetical protein
MVRHLVDRSPLQFDWVARKKAPAGPAPTAESAQKTFLVKIIDKPEYNHRSVVESMPTSGCWPRSDAVFQQTSVPRAALRQSVPRDMAFEGLSDWDSAGQLADYGPAYKALETATDFIRERQARRARRRRGPQILGTPKAWGSPPWLR